LYLSERRSPRKQQQQRKEIDLERLLRDCAEADAPQATFLQLKDISNGMLDPPSLDAILTIVSVDERLTRPLVKDLIHSAKRSAVHRRHRHQRLLETELYVEWLNQLEYVATALEVSMQILPSSMSLTLL
jgi:hypothetical protein